MTLKEVLETIDRQVEYKFFNSLLENLKEFNISQHDVAHILGVSPATITGLKKAERYKTGGSLRLKLNKIIKECGIELESYDEKKGIIEKLRTTHKIISGNYAIVPKVFRINKTWLIYSDLDDKIGIRILKISDRNCAEYIIGSNLHEDYEGMLQSNIDKPIIIFDLNTKDTHKKDLRIYLWINDTGGIPSIMAGIMTYYRIEGGIDSHKILAIPSKTENPVVQEINKREFFKSNPTIAQYFLQTQPNKLYSTNKIHDEATLQEYVEEKLALDKRNSYKLKLISEIQGINNTDDLKKISRVINNFKS